MQFLNHYLTNNSISFSQELSQKQIEQLHELSLKHDIAHLVGVAAESLPADQRGHFKLFAFDQKKALFRHEKLKGEMTRIFATFEAAQIPYLPLKGAVIRGLYHEPWHRTSCDIDILVPQDRLNDAISALQEKLQYEVRGTERHDISMWSPKGVHLELHFDIDESHVTREQLWENATAEPGSYCYRLTNEMLMMAHIAHMVKHFLNGGCGLRPFLDLWFMQEKLTYEETKLDQLLQDAGLQVFYSKIKDLLEVWFRNGEPDAFIGRMEEYILPGGVYGTVKNGIAMKRTMGYGEGQYLLSRFFPPLGAMKYQYPVLKKHPWLLPWCWLCRAVRHVKNGKARRLGAEYKLNRDFSAKDRNDTEQLLRGLGLKG